MKVGDLVTWRGRIYMVLKAEVDKNGVAIIFNPRTGNKSLLPKENLEEVCK